MGEWKFYVVLALLLGSLRWTAEAQTLEPGLATVRLAADNSQGAFPVVHQRTAAPIYVDAKDAEVVHVATEALANDINSITAVEP